VDESWLHGFVTEVSRRAPILEFTVGESATTLSGVAADRSMARMKSVVCDAPPEMLMIDPSKYWGGTGKNDPAETVNSEPAESAVPSSWAGPESVQDYAVSAIRMKDVAGLDWVYRAHFGIDPKLGDESWKSTLHDISTVSGATSVRVKLVDALASVVSPEEFGAAPSWLAAADPLPGGLDPDAAVVGPESEPLSSPPPSASSNLSSRNSRQLHPGQLAAIYASRGQKVSDDQRRRMTSTETSCIDVYERFFSIPFCASDLSWLGQCLSITRHLKVLNAIRVCSTFPANNPGEIVLRDGMRHIFHFIKSLKTFLPKPKKAKREAAGGAAPKTAISEAMRLRREARARGEDPNQTAILRSTDTGPRIH
jgi:hypothetical protein